MEEKKNNFKSYVVAVYGTLRKGCGNHRILEKCKMIGSGKTSEKFTMYSHFGFPSIAKNGPEDTEIEVELYEVPDKETSDRLDSLEGYPGWYDKQITSVNNKKAYIYTMQESNGSNRPIIKSGDWKNR